MEKEKHIYYCPKCLSTNVQVKAWVNPNQGDHFISLDHEDTGTGWCDDCEDHMALEPGKLELATFASLSDGSKVWWDNIAEPLRSGVWHIQGKQHTRLSDDKCLLTEDEKGGGYEWALISQLYELPDILKTVGWECTDPDNHQYCKKINDHCYDYKEFNRNAFTLEYLTKNSLVVDNLFHNDEYWIEDTIDMSKYTDKEIQNHISAYHEDLDELKSIYGNYWKQVVCECIFEQESGLY